MDKHLLTPCDHSHRYYPIVFVNKYEGELLDSSPIRAYFERVYKRFPLITGRFENEGPNIFLRATNEPVRFTEITLEREPEIETLSSHERIITKVLSSYY